MQLWDKWLKCFSDQNFLAKTDRNISAKKSRFQAETSWCFVEGQNVCNLLYPTNKHVFQIFSGTIAQLFLMVAGLIVLVISTYLFRKKYFAHPFKYIDSCSAMTPCEEHCGCTRVNYSTQTKNVKCINSQFCKGGLR